MSAQLPSHFAVLPPVYTLTHAPSHHAAKTRRSLSMSTTSIAVKHDGNSASFTEATVIMSSLTRPSRHQLRRSTQTVRL